MNALSIACSVLQEHDRELAGRLSMQMDVLKQLLLFHDGEEFVPSIRSYNFRGETWRQSLLWTVAGVTGVSALAEQTFSLNDLAGFLLFAEELQPRENTPAALPVRGFVRSGSSMPRVPIPGSGSVSGWAASTASR